MLSYHACNACISVECNTRLPRSSSNVLHEVLPFIMLITQQPVPKTIEDLGQEVTDDVLLAKLEHQRALQVRSQVIGYCCCCAPQQ